MKQYYCSDCKHPFPALGQVSGAHMVTWANGNEQVCFGVALCDCGHGIAQHYNARTWNGKLPLPRLPCHHLGKNDMRCQCKDFHTKVPQ